MRLNRFAFYAAPLALWAVPLAAQDVPGDDDATVAETSNVRLSLAADIVDKSFPEETRVEMFQAVTDQMESQMMQSLNGMITDENARGTIADWQERLSVKTDAIMRNHIPALMDGWVIAYADTYSEPELRDILAFVSTPSGQAFMQRSQELMSHPAFAGANQKYMDETMTVLMDEMPGLMEELIASEANPTE